MSFFLDDSDIYEPQFIHCDYCIHRFPKTDNCTAFPKGIPEKYLTGEAVHKRPVKGGNGIVYEQGRPEGI